MEIISYIALVLLSLLGYSAGAVGKAGKFTELKPQIFDLILVVFIWAGAIYLRATLDINKWLSTFSWMIISIIIGIIAITPRKLPIEKNSKDKQSKGISKNSRNKTWQGWKEFSNRMGSFQSRMILSLFNIFRLMLV